MILDTLSTMMLYNESALVGKFIHALSGKLRSWGIRSVIFTLEEETDKKILSQIGQFCDSVLKC